MFEMLRISMMSDFYGNVNTDVNTCSTSTVLHREVRFVGNVESVQHGASRNYGSIIESQPGLDVYLAV
jgi:hypothetical protein